MKGHLMTDADPPVSVTRETLLAAGEGAFFSATVGDPFGAALDAQLALLAGDAEEYAGLSGAPQVYEYAYRLRALLADGTKL